MRGEDSETRDHFLHGPGSSVESRSSKALRDWESFENLMSMARETGAAAIDRFRASRVYKVSARLGSTALSFIRRGSELRTDETGVMPEDFTPVESTDSPPLETDLPE